MKKVPVSFTVQYYFNQNHYESIEVNTIADFKNDSYPTYYLTKNQIYKNVKKLLPDLENKSLKINYNTSTNKNEKCLGIPDVIVNLNVFQMRRMKISKMDII